MTIRVRAATVADYSVAGGLCVAAYRADGQLPPPPAAVSEEQRPDGFDYSVTLGDVAARAPHGEVLVAVDGDKVLGCVTYVQPGSPYAEISGPDEAEFRMLAVAPSAQGRGVGAALVQACLDRASRQGYAAVAICVRDFSASAKRLYARFGFERVPERDWSPVPSVRLEALRLKLL
jgi:ribosomal protein S18 acetylase RimI-like enzyme